MTSFFLVQTPEGYKTFLNMACVSDAWFGPGAEAPTEVKDKSDPEKNVFIIYMRQILGERRYQNHLWWQGLDAEIVQQEFQKAVRNPQPLHTVVLPAED